MSITAIAAAIINANNTAAANRTADKGSKMAATIARIKRDSNGVLTAAPMVKPEKRAWSLSDDDYKTYTKGVLAVYLSACKVNKASAENHTTLMGWFKEDLTTLLHLCDHELELYENEYTLNLASHVLAAAKKVAVYDDGRHMENASTATFVRELEGLLAIVLTHATFAPDYERDWNKKKVSLPGRIVRIEGKIAAAQERVKDAQAALEKAQKSKSTTAKQMASLQNVLSSEQDALEALKRSLTKAQDALTKAKADYEAAKAEAEQA